MIELIVPLPRSTGEARTFRRVIQRGHHFALPAGDVELFRIGTMARALHRARYTIVQWEKLGWISKPSFLVHGCDRETIRFYCAEQVINANRLLVERYEGRTRFSNTIGLRDFLRELDREMQVGAQAAREGRK